MSKPVIYMVTQKQEDGKLSSRVVKAMNRNQAVAHVVESTITCRPLSPLEVESWLDQGKKIERAKSVPAPPAPVVLTEEQKAGLAEAMGHPGAVVEILHVGGLPAGDQ